VSLHLKELQSQLIRRSQKLFLDLDEKFLVVSGCSKWFTVRLTVRYWNTSKLAFNIAVLSAGDSRRSVTPFIPPTAQKDKRNVRNFHTRHFYEKRWKRTRNKTRWIIRDNLFYRHVNWIFIAVWGTFDGEKVFPLLSRKFLLGSKFKLSERNLCSAIELIIPLFQ
jgi:hypothetical protein